MSNGYSSVKGGNVTLYATCYALLTQLYIKCSRSNEVSCRKLVLESQDAATGYFVGPELEHWSPGRDGKHDREHLLLHLAATTLPVCQEFGWTPRFPLTFAHQWLDRRYLRRWLDERVMSNPWLEGNNILFAGQLLVYLRDVERRPEAQAALEDWFQWLDERVDPETGLWGTLEGASVADAVYGGYHQLLVYYHEGHPIRYPERLVDAVLSLQHPDGGFAPGGGGGACEDVDAVDILVNLYKMLDYRRAEIRWALRRCKRFIFSIQRPDGGFPYGATRRNREFSHMGIPDTRTTRGASAMFPTWFRVHTLALIAEVLTDDEELQATTFCFNSALSMGWHRPWNRGEHPLGSSERQLEEASAPGVLWYARGWGRHLALLGLRASLRARGVLKRKLGNRSK